MTDEVITEHLRSI